MTPSTSGRFAAATSILALLVAMGGTGYAAGKIKGDQIANNAITSKKVKDDALTGRDVKEASLGQVPSAATADSAASATKALSAASAANAANAASVNGVTFTRVDYRAADASGSRVIFQGSGLTIRADCLGALPKLSATTSVSGSFIGTVVHTDGASAPDPVEDDLENDGFDVGTGFNLLATADGNIAVVLFNYRNPGGGVVTGQLSTDSTGTVGQDCSINGFITAG